MKTMFLFITLFILSSLNAQHDSPSTLSSRNGYILPTSGIIRVLVVFVEIEYQHTSFDPSPEGTSLWQKGTLPVWKDSLFDAFATSKPKGVITRYFYEASFGNLLVLGDYLLPSDDAEKPFVVQTSKERISADEILRQISAQGKFKTRHSLEPSDFDLWTLTHIGEPKITPSIDKPPRFDHICIIVRNSIYPTHLSGWTAMNCPAPLYGISCDTYSIFCTQGTFPFNIFLHEFNHQLFGGNNFHAGGSHSKKAGASYFVHLQGGWSMMGAAHRSLLTPNAWDRYRLGWKPAEKHWYISALNTHGTEVPTDLDAFIDEHQGIYILRDFMTTGDALRIKLPHIPTSQYQQWLWIENHQKISPFDRFQYEDDPCMEKALRGIYMYIQIDREHTEGKHIFDGFADYIYPLPASGMYDFAWKQESVQNNWCLNNNMYYPIILKQSLSNPLTGNHFMELIYGDYNNDGRIDIDEYRVPALLHHDTSYRIALPTYGSQSFAFVSHKHKGIRIDTNPSPTNRITCTSATTEIYQLRAPDIRTVYLNGIHIQILGYHSELDGAIILYIRFDDLTIGRNVRWCADTIMFRSRHPHKSDTLIIEPKVTVTIDRPIAVTRMKKQPDGFFSNPSVFVIDSGAVLLMKKRSRIQLKHQSQMIVKPGATVIMQKKARIITLNQSTFIEQPGAHIIFDEHKKKPSARKKDNEMFRQRSF